MQTIASGAPAPVLPTERDRREFLEGLAPFARRFAKGASTLKLTLGRAGDPGDFVARAPANDLTFDDVPGQAPVMHVGDAAVDLSGCDLMRIRSGRLEIRLTDRRVLHLQKAA